MVLRVKANEARKQELVLTQQDEDKDDDEPVVKPRKPRGKPKKAKTPVSKDQPTVGMNPVVAAQPTPGKEPVVAAKPARKKKPVAASKSVPTTSQDQDEGDGEEIDLDLSTTLDSSMLTATFDFSKMAVNSNQAGDTHKDTGEGKPSRRLPICALKSWF
jgi:hypothetical protein